MRLPIIGLIVLFILGILIDWGIYACLNNNKRASKIYAWTCLPCVLLLLAIAVYPRRNPDISLLPAMWMIYLWLTIYCSKLVYLLLEFIGRIPLIFKCHALPLGKYAGIPLSILTFGAMWWGACVTRHQLEITHTEIRSSSLPQSFDGMKIVQLSDLHVGTWGNDTTFINAMVDSVNALNPDLILFTGDIVNVKTKELEPFVNTLSRLKARMGVYSVLGNHDYGDYASWKTPQMKDANRKKMLQLQDSMGWKLLNNTHVFLHHHNDSIAMIGVENWGEPPFHQYGDIFKAFSKDSLNSPTYKILMTHNPKHWELQTEKISNIDLTLSGHTHAMQFIVKAGNKRWSPSCLKYPHWGGLYSGGSMDRPEYLYVNIGLGEVGLPFRIGATPEISLITLRRK